MKHLIFLIIALGFNANSMEYKCKIAGEKAEEIMIKRQAQEDIFKILPLYKEDEDIVFDAYEVPIYDGFKYLANAINARNSIIRADEKRKYEEENDKYKRAIRQFKLKYIKRCLRQQ